MWPVTLAGALIVVATVLPNQLLGALGPLIKRDLGFGDTGLGVVFASSFAVGALVTGWGGRLADRAGSRYAMRLAATATGCTLLAIAVFAQSHMVLLVLFMASAYGNATAMPATNTYIARGVPATRRGLGMGTKLAAVPAASAIAGLTVPAVGETVGWRWAFAGAGLLALFVTFAVPRIDETSPVGGTSSGDASWRVPHLFVLAVGGAFATSAVVTIAGFLVIAAEEAGYSTGRAGLLFSMGAVVLIVVRVSLGVLSDRYDFDRFLAVVGLLMAGTAGFALMATGSKTAILIATPLLFGLGWSWPALYHLGIVERHPDAPGAASGVIQTGFFVGGIVGPLVFGFISDHASIERAWLYSGSTALVGAALVFVGGRLARSEKSTAVGPGPR